MGRIVPNRDPMGPIWDILGLMRHFIGHSFKAVIMLSLLVKKSERNINQFSNEYKKCIFWDKSGLNLTRLGLIWANLGLMRNFIEHSFKVLIML